ncbi:SRPBCC family protein [Kribbella sp. CA-293567]|uniref:SRPBCC family protein n=1 Tax=Kribbella sp. CA-293567 TaxID=3002436 RepID=UPI0022DE6C0D|nr:SRPBCC family protein [Kribbella sp. CA-293567]WBQ01922.1 SRPBCC family protein [Kribbella sp. CA-293567]
MTEQLTSENGRTVLRMERALRHPAEKVWRALTEPSELAAWFPAAVELDLQLSGRITFAFEGEEDSDSGVIRAYDPPRLLEFTWGEEIQRWELIPTADGCLLTLTATYDDRPGSASFTAGWTLCLDALNEALGGSPVPRAHYALLHEYFVRTYGLDAGEVLTDGSLRFERQLTAPKEQVWPALHGLVAEGIEAGPARTAVEPTELSFEWQHGVVTWRLRDGNGGARLVLTQSGPAAQYLAPWREVIEELAAGLAAQTSAG